MLDKDKTVLLVVDVQGQLAQLMHEKESLFKQLGIMIQGIQVHPLSLLGLPIKK